MSAVERRTLVLVLSINAVMFVVELASGWIAESMGLIADSLDMLADAGAYGAALLAVGSSLRRKTHAAALSGLLQLVLGTSLALETVRRAVHGSEPVSLLIVSISLLALCANVACVVLLHEHRDGEIHMRASWIFATNDVQANVGVMLAGVLVALTGTPWPDLAIGLAICGLIVRGGIRILRQARNSYAGMVGAGQPS